MVCFLSKEQTTVARKWPSWCKNWWHKTNTVERKHNQVWSPEVFLFMMVVFLIYINNIDCNISHDMGIKLTFYADYTSILITVKDKGLNFSI